ncbi:MAG: hypothetical protein CMB31_02490 [Euryarchaeota archaeon]|nr:hypothetical protein [Euryarchaeota archaeon]
MVAISSIILSSLMAGIVAILATVFIERSGGAIGAIITLPTTIVPASIGIWIGVNGELVSFSAAMSMVPIGMLLNVLFLGSWRILPSYLEHLFSERNLVVAVGISSVLFWLFSAGVSTIIVEYISNFVGPIYVGICAVFIAFVLGYITVSKGGDAPPGLNRVSLLSLLSRGIAAGLAIGLSVWIAGLGLPFISGVISVFPAIFLTTMVSLWIAQGRSVPVGATGPMMFGSTSVSIYALICILIFPFFGIWAGSLISWLLSVILYSVPVGIITWRTIDA